MVTATYVRIHRRSHEFGKRTHDGAITHIPGPESWMNITQWIGENIG